MPIGYPASRIDPSVSPRLSVVVVDNDMDTLSFVCSALAMAAISVEGCPCNDRTSAYIRYKRPRLVLLNAVNGDRDCLNIFVALRTDPLTERIAVLISSSNAAPLREKLALYDTSLVRFLAHPYPLDILVQIVGRMCAGMV